MKRNLLSPSATNWSTKESTFFFPLLPSFIAVPDDRGRLRKRREREREGRERGRNKGERRETELSTHLGQKMYLLYTLALKI